MESKWIEIEVSPGQPKFENWEGDDFARPKSRRFEKSRTLRSLFFFPFRLAIRTYDSAGTKRYWSVIEAVGRFQTPCRWEPPRTRFPRSLRVSLRERNVPPSRIGGHAGRAPFSRRERDRENKRPRMRVLRKGHAYRERYLWDRGARARADECLDPLIADARSFFNYQQGSATRYETPWFISVLIGRRWPHKSGAPELLGWNFTRSFTANFSIIANRARDTARESIRDGR